MNFLNKEDRKKGQTQIQREKNGGRYKIKIIGNQRVD